jgi:hypothetical protein
VLAFHDSKTVCALGWTPVPARVIFAGEPKALLVTDRDPLEIPALVGVKLIEVIKVCPGVRVTGVPAPDTPKLVPDALICEIRTSELPVLVITTP